MNERIKQVRKALNMTQESFAESLALSRNFITQIEMGIKVPSDRTIIDICREFNVNKDWLLTGEGEMFIQLSRDEQIAEFVGKALAGSPDNIKRSLLAALVVLPESGWDALEKFVDKLIEQRTKKETTDE